MAVRLSATVFLILLTGLATSAFAQEEPKQKGPDGLKALKDEDPKIRYNSVALLGKLGAKAKLLAPVLLEMLDDPDLKVKLKVAETLWKLDPPPTTKVIPILKTALKDKDNELRGMALSVAQQMGNKAKELMPEVRDALKDKNFGLRMRAVFVVGEMGASGKTAIPELIGILETDDTGFLEATVAIALSKIGFRAVTPLRDSLSHKNAQVRRGSAYALSLIGRKAYQAVPELRKALSDDNAVVRAFSAQALGNIGRDAEPALVDLQTAMKNNKGSVRIDSALAIWKIAKDKSVIPVLSQAYASDKNYENRISAIRALGEMRPPTDKQIGSLIVATQDISPGVRATACRSLVKVGPVNKVWVQDLKDRLKDEKKVAVQIQFARAIGLLDGKVDKKCIEVLESALANDSRSVRKGAVQAMKDLGPIVAGSVNSLAKLLRDDSEEIRQLTREAILAIDRDLAKKIGIQQ